MSRVDAVSLFLSAFLARTTFSDTYYLPMQPDLQQAMKDRRFPTYLAPIKDITDEVLRDILPIPSDIQHLTEIFTHVSNAKWVQQFRRLRMPRPSKRANLHTIHPDAKVDDICTDAPVAEGTDAPDRDDSHDLSRESEPCITPEHASPHRSLAGSLASDLSHLEEYDDENCPSHCGIEFKLMAKTKIHVIPEEVAFLFSLICACFCQPCVSVPDG